MSTASELRHLVCAAEDFREVLDRECWHSPEWWAMGGNDVEAHVEPVAIALAKAIEVTRSLGDAHLPRQVRRGLGELRRLFDALIDRWGWREVIGPGREAYVAGRRERFQAEVELPFLRVNLAWRNAEVLEKHRWADHWADVAEARGIAPAEMTPEEAAEKVSPLWNRLGSTPILGDHLPSVNAEDLGPLQDAIQAIASGIADDAASSTPADHDAGLPVWGAPPDPDPSPSVSREERARELLEVVEPLVVPLERYAVLRRAEDPAFRWIELSFGPDSVLYAAASRFYEVASRPWETDLPTTDPVRQADVWAVRIANEFHRPVVVMGPRNLTWADPLPKALDALREIRDMLGPALGQAGAPVPSPTFERDAWMYQEASKGVPWAKIVTGVKEKGWPGFKGRTPGTAARRAANRWALRQTPPLPELEPRKRRRSD